MLVFASPASSCILWPPPFTLIFYDPATLALCSPKAPNSFLSLSFLYLHPHASNALSPFLALSSSFLRLQLKCHLLSDFRISKPEVCPWPSILLFSSTVRSCVLFLHRAFQIFNYIFKIQCNTSFCHTNRAIWRAGDSSVLFSPVHPLHTTERSTEYMLWESWSKVKSNSK